MGADPGDVASSFSQILLKAAFLLKRSSLPTQCVYYSLKKLRQAPLNFIPFFRVRVGIRQTTCKLFTIIILAVVPQLKGDHKIKFIVWRDYLADLLVQGLYNVISHFSRGVINPLNPQFTPLCGIMALRTNGNMD